MYCLFCDMPIYGGKGDYWHTHSEDMYCDDRQELAVPSGDAGKPENWVDYIAEFECGHLRNISADQALCVPVMKVGVYCPLCKEMSTVKHVLTT